MQVTIAGGFVMFFFLSLLRAGIEPTLDPSTETISRCMCLPRETGGELVGVCECVRDVGEGRLSRREQLVGYLQVALPQGVAYCPANMAGTSAATAH